MKQLKKVIALLALALVLTGTTMYAVRNVDAQQDKPNPATTVTKQTKGECKGHELGQCQHEEGSAACQEKHAKGKCKGHK